jgi:hypothetical protein
MGLKDIEISSSFECSAPQLHVCFALEALQSTLNAAKDEVILAVLQQLWLDIACAAASAPHRS